MTLRSTEKLGRALEDAGLPVFAQRARDGEFGDFTSPHGMPLHYLVTELSQYTSGLRTPIGVDPGKVKAIVIAVKDGEYDATEEERQEYMAGDLKKDLAELGVRVEERE